MKLRAVLVLVLGAGVVAGCDSGDEAPMSEPLTVGWIDDQTMRQGGETSLKIHIARLVMAPVTVRMEGLPPGVVWVNQAPCAGDADVLEATLAASHDAKPVTRKEVRVIAEGMSGERAEGSFLLTVEEGGVAVSE